MNMTDPYLTGPIIFKDAKKERKYQKEDEA